MVNAVGFEADCGCGAQECNSVVGLKDLMEDRDYAYIVLELCKGPDLEAVLEVRGEPSVAPPRHPSERAACCYPWPRARGR